MIDKSIGKRIQEGREKSGISQETLAEKIGLSVTAVSNIERGINYPTLENFIKIANVINVSPDLLLCDVVNAATITKSSELYTKIRSLSLKRQHQIFAVIEVLISTGY